MSWRTHPLTVKLRNVARAAGLTSRIAPLLAGRGYETAFEEATLACVRPGDVVWDVGANVGLYTVKFAAHVGGEGQVFAFEPSPANQERLAGAVAALPNVRVLPLALGDRDGAMRFAQGDDALGATSRLLDAAAKEEGIEVRVARGDSLVRAGEVPAPNVVKADTEGFELDVLLGLGDVLRSPALRALCIEVHFGLMNERGVPDGPRRIERMLADAGFRRRWTDPSHLVAARAAS